MTKPVKIVVGVDGSAESKSALKSIKQAVIDMETEASAAVAKGSDKRSTAHLKEIATRVKALNNLAETIKKVEEQMNRAGGRGPRAGLPGTNTMSPVMSALIGGEGLGSMLKAAGMAGIAIKGFMGGIDLATASIRQFSSFVVNDVLKPGMALQTKAMQMANNSAGAVNSDELQRSARAIGLKHNMDPIAIVDSAAQFQDLTGDSKMAPQIVDLLATLSKGRGVEMGAMTGLAGALYKPGISKDELEKQILNLTKQGEQGSVRIDQLANLGGRFTAPMNHLAGTDFTRTMEMGALLQTAKPSIGSADMAMSSIDALFRDAFKPTSKALSTRSFIKDASGVEKIGDVGAFIGDVLRKTGGGNITKLTTAGFSAEGAKVVQAYAPEYEKGFQEAKAGGATDAKAAEAGTLAVENFIKSLMTSSTSIETENANLARVMGTSGERFATGMNEVKEEIAKGLMPIVDDFAASLDVDSIRDAAQALTSDLRDLSSGVKAALDLLPKGTAKAVYEGLKGGAAGFVGGPLYSLYKGGNSLYQAAALKTAINPYGDQSPSSAAALPGYENDGLGVSVSPTAGQPVFQPAPFPGGPLLSNLDGGSSEAGSSDTSEEATANVEDLGKKATDTAAALQSVNRELANMAGAMSQLNRNQSLLDR